MILDLRRCVGLAVLICAVGALGCGSEPKVEVPETYAASGTVTYKGGSPVAEATIDFRPASGADTGLIVNAVTDEQGKFTIMTRHMNDRMQALQKSGAPAGEYKVTIIPKQPSDRSAGFVPPVTLPKAVKVEAKENSFTFEIGKK
jgi:hypothetical protein